MELKAKLWCRPEETAIFQRDLYKKWSRNNQPGGTILFPKLNNTAVCHPVVVTGTVDQVAEAELNLCIWNKVYSTQEGN